MKVAIIEDEKPAARLLESMIRELRPAWEITQIPGSVEEATAWYATHAHPDILFLDIRLSDGNSFLFIERARPTSLIIFTTAYDEYALRAFAVNSIDYLLKPILPERLAEAIAKYERLVPATDTRRVDDLLDSLQSLVEGKQRYRTRFLVRGHEEMTTLPVGEVAYFYTENRVTFAVTHAGREHILDLSLDRLAEQLDPRQFFRANRQFILNVESVTRLEPYFGGKIIVHTRPATRERVVVSKEKVPSLKLWLNF